MERNKIEGLFKDKLERYILEPSNDARDRFQGMIHRKRQKVLIRRIGIAASVLLFTFAGIYSFRTLNSDKIDLAGGESIDAVYDPGLAIVKEVPSPGSIPADEDDEPKLENEIAYKIKSSSTEGLSTENLPPDTPKTNSQIAQTNDSEKFESTMDHPVSANTDQEYDQLLEGQVDESTYIEYFVADPDLMKDEQSNNITTDDQPDEPMKITIEYIASGNKDTQSETKRSNFYSKLDNMKSMNEVLGDLRSYKDRLFALDFKKEEKVKKEEKSKE